MLPAGPRPVTPPCTESSQSQRAFIIELIPTETVSKEDLSQFLERAREYYHQLCEEAACRSHSIRQTPESGGTTDDPPGFRLSFRERDISSEENDESSHPTEGWWIHEEPGPSESLPAVGRARVRGYSHSCTSSMSPSRTSTVPIKKEPTAPQLLPTLRGFPSMGASDVGSGSEYAVIQPHSDWTPRQSADFMAPHPSVHSVPVHLPINHPPQASYVEQFSPDMNEARGPLLCVAPPRGSEGSGVPRVQPSGYQDSSAWTTHWYYDLSDEQQRHLSE